MIAVIPARGGETSNLTRLAAVAFGKFGVAVTVTWRIDFKAKFVDRIAAEI